MRLYETTFILNSQTDDATIDRQVADVSAVITNNDGKIISENRMGTRRLAYPIQGLLQGYYADFVFEGQPTIVQVLERHYRLGEAYLRYLTVLFEGDLDQVTGGSAEEHKPDRRELPSRPREEPLGRREAPAPAAVESAPAEEATEAPETTESTAPAVEPIAAAPTETEPTVAEVPPEVVPAESEPTVAEVPPEVVPAESEPAVAEEAPVEKGDTDDQTEQVQPPTEPDYDEEEEL